MIKAEDIRIGDLVRVCRNGWFPEGTVCIVTQVNSERTRKEKKGCVTLSYVDGTDDGSWGVWCSHIEGVPLTPAILEKKWVLFQRATKMLHQVYLWFVKMPLPIFLYRTHIFRMGSIPQD